MTRRNGLASWRIKLFVTAGMMTRRAGVSRRLIFRGQGEVCAKLKLETDVRLTPFNLGWFKVSSYFFPRAMDNP